jgi:hypothetical protein
MTKQQIQIEVSKQISFIEQNQFAYLGPVLRTALFSGSSQIDWDAVAKEFCKQNPEYKG